AIAKRIASMIRLLGNRNYPIVILVDREDRVETCEELTEQLLKALKVEGIMDQDLRIGFADRMIENWIIADFNLIGKLNEKPQETDGLKGSSIIKKHKGSYHKVTDGVSYLLSVDKAEVYKNSKSYKSFIDKLHGINCNYLEFEK
ncbi:MAG: hypothetical protein ACKVQB_10700, partial [Bacteroidia bacterium]